MRNHILTSIEDKNSYLAVVDAVGGEKKAFTDEEKTQLLAVYADKASNKFGFSEESLLKLLIVMDTAQEKGVPDTSALAEEVSREDFSALCALCALYMDWEQKPELALKVKKAALDMDVSNPLALALARAALDALAAKRDISLYREDIIELSAFLRQADSDAFADASRFLLRVQERAQMR